jgi:hypothetical protein
MFLAQREGEKVGGKGPDEMGFEWAVGSGWALLSGRYWGVTQCLQSRREGNALIWNKLQEKGKFGKAVSHLNQKIEPGSLVMSGLNSYPYPQVRSLRQKG